MKRRAVLLFALAVASAFVLAAAASADAPVVSTQTVDSTTQSAFWSDACGVPVFFRNQGTVTARFQSGVLREVDTFPSWTVTVSSPVAAGGTGKSFSFKQPYPIRFLYPEGTDLGDPAKIIASGHFDIAAPGGPSIAGREIDDAVIVDYTPEGIPVVDFVGTASTTGHFPDFDVFVAARCAFLTDP